MHAACILIDGVISINEYVHDDVIFWYDFKDSEYTATEYTYADEVADRMENYTT